MCDEVYTSMYGFLDHARGLAFAGSKCYAVAEVRANSGSPNYEVIVTQNSASGLMNGGARNYLQNAHLNVTYFSVANTAPHGMYTQIQPSEQITRVAGRHAEMNVVMYCVARFLEEFPGGLPRNFCLDTYCGAVNPSLNFCPECQFALALLSRPWARLIGRISDLIRNPKPDQDPPVLLLRGSGQLSPNWGVPWTTYYDDVEGSDFFQTVREQHNGLGHYSVGFDVQTRDVVVYLAAATGWVEVHRARGRQT
jgi:hypothetical protein